jgi:hypothetical protein
VGHPAFSMIDVHSAQNQNCCVLHFRAPVAREVGELRIRARLYAAPSFVP